MSSTSNNSPAALAATYDSPSGSRNFEYSISTPEIEEDGKLSAEAKTKYVSELRASSKKLQEDINKFLTEKMEEDKKKPGQNSGNGTTKEKSKDELEEENYGEENEQDDT
ncbi:uncharacterized protein Z520_07343 [Fonsecaea multimorphosa CBS 102226]|uniref:EKC/KEOPS complex subunit GON7 n=1 Tax=Fonsecaea multimorphosa CBS 102226 TaxID=1442371 RepID=A0A0D2KKS4_9EURO|nr:uncharacterized protein Z520_07343 [Fonsecaea multimorphosa CBS 102226]KIX97228.1 hypothetical protein Z520_07343 [Fonsecaea multimorphosa CBS 102226]OAL23000.1 hypothetical protein AYO22_06908 [Fonsecaea multimorphosa]